MVSLVLITAHFVEYIFVHSSLRGLKTIADHKKQREEDPEKSGQVSSWEKFVRTVAPRVVRFFPVAFKISSPLIYIVCSIVYLTPP